MPCNETIRTTISAKERYGTGLQSALPKNELLPPFLRRIPVPSTRIVKGILEYLAEANPLRNLLLIFNQQHIIQIPFGQFPFFRYVEGPAIVFIMMKFFSLRYCYELIHGIWISSEPALVEDNGAAPITLVVGNTVTMAAATETPLGPSLVVLEMQKGTPGEELEVCQVWRVGIGLFF